MALRHLYTAICEQARMEMFGKFSLIGVTTAGIGLPQVPFAVPMLTFFNVLETDAPGPVKFTGTLTHLASGAVVARAQGVIQPPQAGAVVMPMQFQSVQFSAFGVYTWSLEFEGHEPFVTEFAVNHVPQPKIKLG
jgi:hypothetical protein